MATSDISRRSFLKASGAALGASGLLVLAGCGPADDESDEDETEDETEDTEEEETEDTETEETEDTETEDEEDEDTASVTLGDGETLRVGMEAAYAPYNWQETEESDTTIPIENVSGGYADGYDVQIAKKIAEAFGMEPVAVKLDWSGLIDSLNSGQIDIICAGMSVTDERAESADFSDSYLDDDIVLITTSDSEYADATTFDDLAGASVLGQASTMFDDVIDQIPDVNHMTPAETVPLVVENLAGGACDVITYSEMSAPKLLETYPDFVQLEMTDKFEDSEMPDNAAIAKGQEDALALINEVINGISEEERQEIWDDCMERQPS